MRGRPFVRRPSLLRSETQAELNATCDVVLVVVSGPPVEVGVTMYVLSISSLSEVKMVLSLLYPRADRAFPHARSLTRALGGLGKRVGVMCWLLACRPARGGGSHNVRAEHQLAVRGPDGIYQCRTFVCCVSRPRSRSNARESSGAAGGQA